MSGKIFEFAMQMEKDGEDYYRYMASRCTNPGLKSILELLADDEVKHYRTLEKLKADSIEDIADTEILAGAKNIFAQMERGGSRLELDISEMDMYKKAALIEKKSEDFYREKAREIDNPRAREILLKIADQEKRHRFLLENMMEFIERPQTWVENAEFYHLEDY
jgi:rubrerythrin